MFNIGRDLFTIGTQVPNTPATIASENITITIYLTETVIVNSRKEVQDKGVCTLTGQLLNRSLNESRDNEGFFNDCDYVFYTGQEIPFTVKEVNINKYKVDIGDGSKYEVHKVKPRPHVISYNAIGLRSYE